MAGAQGQAASQAPTSPEAYAPTGYAVRVLCNKGHPLTGLFVVWSERAPQGAAAPGGGGGTPEDEILKVADRHAPPPGRFAAGFVDRAGYLQPVFRGVNPWADLHTDRRPHTYKIQPDRKYPLVLLRHPSAALARALADWLNAPAGSFDFGPWGGKGCFGGDDASPEKLVRELDLTTQPPGNVTPPAGGAKELYLVVPESPEPEAYWPKGHALYGGWTLYLDMPNAGCAPVIDEVKRLQKHLGALRYPIGIQERPYWPQERKKELPSGNLGILELRTAAALARFQEHAAAASAFKLTSKAAAEVHGKLLQDRTDPREPIEDDAYPETETWAGLLGREVGPKLQSSDAAANRDAGGILPEIEPADVLRGHAWGVVDAATGKALELWLARGYRKPGQLLLRVKGPPAGFVYLREEAAVQLEGWRQLLGVFGVSYPRCPYGMPSGHSFRDISGIARGVAGVLNNSIHKTGLAIDFYIASNRHDADFTLPHRDWPIRMEQRFDRPARDPGVLARRQLETAEQERRAASAQRAEDARRLQASGGATPPPAAPPAPPASRDGARRQSALAGGNASRAQAKAARPGAGVDVLQKAVAADDALLAALDAEIAFLRREIAALDAREAADKTKSGFRMRFCLYGHSSLDVFGGDRAATLKRIVGDVERLGATLERHLLAQFPASVQAEAQAWIRCVALASYLDPSAVRSKLPATPELVASTFFRCAIRPFLFDPLEPDGGTSWTKALVAGPSVQCPTALKPLRPGEDDVSCVPDVPGAIPSGMQPFSGSARSFVSLSALGHLCDLFGIGTAGSRWKQALATLDASRSLSPIAERIEAAARHDQAKEEDVVFARRKQVVARLRPDKLDVAFLRDWAAALGDLAVVDSGGKKRPSACYRVKGPRLVVRLAPPELASDGDRVVSVLKGKLAGKRFVVLDPGRETGLLELPRAGALAGSDLGAKVEAASKALRERVEALRKASAAAKEEAKKQGRPAPKQEPDLAKRDRTWFELTLQPLFEAGVTPAADLGNVVLQPGDVVQVAAPGIPRTLEWWHFQSLAARGEPWEEQVQEIGFSLRILKAGDPPEQDGGDWDGRGVGYTQPELESAAGGEVAVTPPSNTWAPPPAGW